MNTTRKAIAALTATAAVLALGVSSASAAGWGNGRSMMGRGNSSSMMSYGGQSYGRSSDCTGTTAATGTLTAAEKDALIALTGEEKLAHDVYVTLAAKYPTLTQFARIANSETRHVDAMRSLLAKYGLKDPTAGLPVGTFASATRQAQYDSLVAKATDAASALAVGVAIEKLDIADLADILKTVTAPDVKQVLTMLDRASDMHLAAFGG